MCSPYLLGCCAVYCTSVPLCGWGRVASAPRLYTNSGASASRSSENRQNLGDCTAAGSELKSAQEACDTLALVGVIKICVEEEI